MTVPDRFSPTEKRPSGTVRKVAVAVTGTAVTAAGVVMLVTPGPGILAILGGLGILSSEFAGPRRTLDRLRRRDSEQID